MFTSEAIKKLNISHTTLQNYYNKGYIKRKRIGKHFDYNDEDIDKIIEYKKLNNTRYYYKSEIIPWNKNKHFKRMSRKKMSISRKEFFKRNPNRKKECGEHSKLTLIKLKKKYPFFAQIEEMRYNPDKPGKKEIQIHCKNHNCKNSKEKKGWFIPTYIQLYERIRSLEKNGKDHAYFYCSDKCKQECPLYYSKGRDPFKDQELSYTYEEKQIWNQTLLERDNYECQMCGSKENLHCHHIIPIKLEPMLALDPDNGIVLCEDCHYKIGHKTGTECSTGNLAKIICKKGLEMDFDYYQRQCETTDVGTSAQDCLEPGWLYYVLGVAGETGEMVEKVKKLFRDKKGVIDNEFIQQVIKENGDIMWYQARFLASLGINYSEVAKTNLEKLKSRQERNVLHGEGDER
jgi:NTP pyrophosphatase (non-canonical NTP hydrolase)